jgi:hypothetical protein
LGIVDRDLVEALLGPQLEALRAEEVFEQQARRVVSQMLAVGDHWPTGFSMAFHGPNLGQVERRLYSICSYNADDRGRVFFDRSGALAAAGLEDHQESWALVLGALTSLRAVSIDMVVGALRREFRLVDAFEVSADGAGLQIQLGADLLRAVRGEGRGDSPPCVHPT